MKITPTSHPKLFEAMHLIDLDCGAVNRLEPVKEFFETNLDCNADEAEQGLAALSEQNFKDFCIGDETSIQFLLLNDKRLESAERLLIDHFSQMLAEHMLDYTKE